ncbi:MAG: M50 family metallopeptidase [Armatimonadota bacterium]
MEKVLLWFAVNWLALIKVILVFGAIIFIHELGHFIAAKRVGVRVHEFAIGMGPKILGWKKGETFYAWRLFPIGGFVSIEGEDSKCESKEDKGNFQNRTVWERFKIISAGCIMNYLMAVILFFVIAFSFGVVKVPLTVEKVIPGTPAQSVGLLPGDKIVAVNNEYMNLPNIINYMHTHPDEDVNITVVRGKEELNINTKIGYDKEYDIGRIGVIPSRNAFDFYFKKATVGEAAMFSIERTYEITMTPFYIIKLIASKQVSGKEIVKTAAGPIGIGQIIFVIAQKGLPNLIYFVAILSALIGMFNLLPLPALDGGRIVFLIIEGIRRKPIDQELEGKIHWVGLIALLGLALLISYQDVMRIIKGTPLIK